MDPYCTFHILCLYPNHIVPTLWTEDCKVQGTNQHILHFSCDQHFVPIPYCTVLHRIAPYCSLKLCSHQSAYLALSLWSAFCAQCHPALLCKYNANICCQQVPPSFHCNDAQLSKRKHFYEVWPQVSQNILHWSVRKHSWKNDLIGAFQVLLGHKEAGVVRWWTLKWKRLPKSPEQPKTHNNRCSSSQNRTEQKKSIFYNFGRSFTTWFVEFALNFVKSFCHELVTTCLHSLACPIWKALQICSAVCLISFDQLCAVCAIK